MDIDLIKMHLMTARNKEHHDQYGWNDLHAAVASGKLEEVNQLKQNKSLVNASSSDGWTPLHVAVGLSGENKDNVDRILDALLGADADCNARNKDGLTPMHVAAALHHDHAVSVVKKLAEKVVFPDARDCKGRTALHIAAAKNKCPKVVCLLCKKKEVLDAQDKAGDTPLHKAAAKTKNPDIVKLLLVRGANPWLRNGKAQLPCHLAERNKKIRSLLTTP